MRNGWLVVNGYLNSAKFDEIYEWLVKAADNQGCNLRKITNDQLCSILSLDNRNTSWNMKPDFVLFWDKDVRLARMLEKEGFKVYNSAEAIETCDDKALTFIKLKNTNIKIPKTYVAPVTFESKYSDYAFLHQVESALGYPMVIKENKGSFGAQVYLVNNHEEAVETIEKIGHCNFVMQQFIDHSKGKDVRIQVVGDQVVTAMMRTNDNDFRANITNGGVMSRYEPTEAQKQMAVEACKLIGVDFAGVDILFGKDDEPILCEINSNAHFKNIYDCTGVNVADKIIEYILEQIG